MNLDVVDRWAGTSEPGSGRVLPDAANSASSIAFLGVELVYRCWTPEEIALCEVTSRLVCDVEMFLCFDALGDRDQAETSCTSRQKFEQRSVSGDVDVDEETAIDLDDVHWKVSQRSHRG